jgi:hypothetical protein
MSGTPTEERIAGGPRDAGEHRERVKAALLRGGWLGGSPKRRDRRKAQLEFRDRDLAPGACPARESGAAEVT